MKSAAPHQVAPHASPAPARRSAFLVLGMHRSGTSAVAGLLDHLGVPTPGELLPPQPDNPKGFFENKAVYEFHDRVLAHFGSAWDDPMPVSLDWLESPAGEGFVEELVAIVRAELLTGTAVFTVKDPRMCRFVPLWLAALARLETAPHAVIPLRHPAEVAGSLAKRNGFVRAKSFLLWLQHTLAAERQTRGVARSFVSYEGLLDDWRGASDRMAGELGFAWPRERGRVEAAVDGFLSAEMRHHTAPTAIGSATALDALVARAWAALESLVLRQAQDEGGEQALGELDAVWDELQGACAVVGPYVAWEFRTLDVAAREVDRLTTLGGALRADRADAEAVFRKHLSEAEGHFRKSLAESQHVANAQRMMAERERRMREGAEANAEHLRNMEGITAEAHGRELAALRAEATILTAERDRLRALSDGMAASTSWRATQPLRGLATGLPPSLRTLMRRAAKAGWWALTPWRMPTRVRVAAALAKQAPEAPPSRVLAAVAKFVPPEIGERTIENAYADWVTRFDTLTDKDRWAIRQHIATLGARPTISVVVPAYNTAETLLREMVASVQRQLYPHWELCIADDASSQPHVVAVLEELAAEDPRIKWMRRDRNGHIAAASNSALTLATGDFVALLDHDDLLAEQALYEIAVAVNAHPDADILFSDEDKIDENGQRYDPYFKPDFNYEQLLGQNMVSHLGVYRRSILEAIGGFELGVEGSQDYDLVLRAIAASGPEKVHHIPAVLYHWRQEGKGASFSQANLDQCVSAARRSITRQIEADPSGRPGEVIAALAPAYNRVKWPLPDPAPLVSIVIPTRDRADLLRRCLDGLLHRTNYGALEIIIVDNDSHEPATAQLFAEMAGDPRVRVIQVPGPFNYSALNNAAVAEAKGEVLLLLNNDIDVIDGGWLEEMVSLLSRPGIGIVGAKLIYEDGRVQHGGVRLGAGRSVFGGGVAGHFGLMRERMDVGYFALLALTREVSAVTGACLAIRKDLFQEVGGLDEEHLAVAFNDVDLCLKVKAKGYRILWTPFAELFHLESATRGSDASPEKAARFEAECRFMLGKWGEELANDPFYPPAFDNAVGDLLLAYPPRRAKPWQAFLTGVRKSEPASPREAAAS